MQCELCKDLINDDVMTVAMSGPGDVYHFSTEPSIGASHQVSVHLAKQLQRRFLEIDQSETRMACGDHVY